MVTSRFSWVVCAVALLAVLHGRESRAADFVTTASIDFRSLGTEFFEATGRFYADVTVRNVSAKPQVITVWTNPSWSWITDSKDVVTSQEAAKNFPTRVVLKPHEIYKTGIEMATDPRSSKRKRTIFRLGFLPNVDRPVIDAKEPALIWTNALTLSRP
jgi:hypothetical protein